MERPILFSTEMVQAILSGNKTQTRRVVKPTPSETGVAAFNDGAHPSMKCPYGNPGDVLWVREAFKKGNSLLLDDVSVNYYIFKDGSQKYSTGEYFQHDIKDMKGPWKPSIHMPKDACRIWLEIVDVRIERVQDISNEDAVSEGIGRCGTHGFLNYMSNIEMKCFAGGDKGDAPKKSFESLWTKINGAESWLNNPWVWVIEFKRIDKPEVK